MYKEAELQIYKYLATWLYGDYIKIHKSFTSSWINSWKSKQRDVNIQTWKWKPIFIFLGAQSSVKRSVDSVLINDRSAFSSSNRSIHFLYDFIVLSHCWRNSGLLYFASLLQFIDVYRSLVLSQHFKQVYVWTFDWTAAAPSFFISAGPSRILEYFFIWRSLWLTQWLQGAYVHHSGCKAQC